MKDAAETQVTTGRPLQLAAEPKDSDPGSNSYIITYLTRKHGRNHSEISFDYGPNLDVPASELKEGSFNGSGDNMMWGEVLWRFSMEGNICLLRVSMVSGTRAAGTAQLVLPTDTLHLPDGSPVTPKFLQSMASYPFSESGSLRDAKELGRDSGGEVAFIDVSDKQGQGDAKTSEVLSHLKSSGSVRNLMGANGPEFASFDNLRYAGPGGNLMRPDGMADMVATKKVRELLQKKETPEENPEGNSVFKPIEKKEEQGRFAKEMSLEDANSAAKELNTSLENTKQIAKDLGFVKSACVHNTVLAFYHKKAKILS